MVFAHDSEAALQSAVELVNSAEAPDTLTDLDQLSGFLARHGYTGVLRGDAAELAEVRAVRPVLRDLLTCDRDAAVDRVNDLLAQHHALPRLVRHGEMGWHLHAVEDDRPLAVRVAVETAMAMIDVIRAGEMSRLAICADDDCNGIVLDLSRNRSRIFCSTTCGNRAAVAAYRARKA